MGNDKKQPRSVTLALNTRGQLTSEGKIVLAIRPRGRNLPNAAIDMSHFVYFVTERE